MGGGLSFKPDVLPMISFNELYWCVFFFFIIQHLLSLNGKFVFLFFCSRATLIRQHAEDMFGGFSAFSRLD